MCWLDDRGEVGHLNGVNAVTAEFKVVSTEDKTECELTSMMFSELIFSIVRMNSESSLVCRW